MELAIAKFTTTLQDATPGQFVAFRHDENWCHGVVCVNTESKSQHRSVFQLSPNRALVSELAPDKGVLVFPDARLELMPAVNFGSAPTDYIECVAVDGEAAFAIIETDRVAQTLNIATGELGGNMFSSARTTAWFRNWRIVEGTGAERVVLCESMK